MPYAIALVLVAVFTANVAYGAVGSAAPLGIVVELLLLLGASIAFAVGILRSEARAREEGASKPGEADG